MEPVSLKIILEDGDPHGLRTATMDNWDGLAIACPREQISRLKKQNKVAHAGVYLLLGNVADEHSQKEKILVYVGESEQIFDRIHQQNRDTTKEDTWQWVLILTGNINKADALWLEWRMMNEINQAGRAELHGQNIASEKFLNRSEKIKMDEFFRKTKQVLPVLGADICLERLNAPNSGAITKQTRFIMTIKNALARCVIEGDKTVILKGSTALSEDMSSLSISRSLERKTLIQRGVLSLKAQGLLEFKQNYSFNSPSAAASMVAGYNANGRALWLVEETKQTYADWSSSHG